MKGDASNQAISARFEPEVIKDNMEELPKPMHGNFQIGRVEQAQAEKLQRAAAQRARENPGHFIVELDRERAVQRRELFLGDARAGAVQKLARDVRARQMPVDDLRLCADAAEETIDERDRYGCARSVHDRVPRGEDASA